MRSAYLHFRKIPCATVRSLVWLVLALALVQQLGCGVAPVQEMSEARQAIEAARVAGAEVYAPAGYQRARTLMTDAERMLSEHHFSRARTNAVLARDEAIQARETALEARPGD
jgi:hypothetical protein